MPGLPGMGGGGMPDLSKMTPEAMSVSPTLASLPSLPPLSLGTDEGLWM